MTKLDPIGLAHELDFWRAFVHSAQFATWLAPGPTPGLLPQVIAFFEPSFKVLDVGSGVVSILNGLVADLTAADPLSPGYQTFFNYARHNLRPPVPVAGEDLTYTNEFDLVHISNALDHSVDPALVFKKLITALKPGGLLIIAGFENECRHQRGAGLHQWDLELGPDALLTCTDSSRTRTTTLLWDDRLEDALLWTDRRMLPHLGKDWITWVARKKHD